MEVVYMKRQEIYDKLKEIISETFKGDVDTGKITEDTDLQEEVGINSVVGIEILVRVEDAFDITIEDEDLTTELTKTLVTLADYIEKSLASQA
jgi:acyl carrier protein